MNNNINNKLIDFYINNGTDHKGRTFEDLINKNNLFLEYNHDYIQWLFPLNIKSNSNHSAPVLDQNTINILLYNDIFQPKMIKALECMLKFYVL